MHDAKCSRGKAIGPDGVDGDLLANHAHPHNQKRNSGRRHNAKNSNNVPQTTDESFHLLETGKNKSDNDDDVAGNFRYEASWLNGLQMRTACI